MSFSDFIYSRRLDMGLSQAELGRRIGVTQATIGNWERGHAPASTVRVKLARVLGVGVKEINNMIGLSRRPEQADKGISWTRPA